MALHITRISRPVTFSLLSARSLNPLLHARTIAPAYSSEVFDKRVSRKIDDNAIWARGISRQELIDYRCSVPNNNVTWKDVICEGKVNSVDTSGASSGPSPSQLEAIRENLAHHLPKLFVMSLNYKIFHQDLIYENNIRGTRTVGVLYFAKQVALLRMLGHLKYAYVKLDVLKMTSHPEDNTVRVRWRIRGISMFSVVTALWKYKLWDIRAALKDLDSWHDGFSTFYVGADGLIYKHVVDKMMPDQETRVSETKTRLTPKVALILGLLPENTLSLSELCLCSKETHGIMQATHTT